jgi:hypothetical protein
MKLTTKINADLSFMNSVSMGYCNLLGFAATDLKFCQDRPKAAL